jgi:hypothetical protein
MKKINFLLLWVLMAIAVITVSSNRFQLRPGKPAQVPEAQLASALFACPAADKQFDSMAATIKKYRGGMAITYSALVLLWIFLIAWVLYQALVKDKFDEKDWSLPIWLGKFLAFLPVIWVISNYSPNNFRNVSINGTNADWVLCERDSPGARAVRAASVSAK